jgi:arylsulfatase A-like enzyme
MPSPTRRQFVAAGAAAALGGAAVLSRVGSDSAKAVERPNVLVVFIDTLRADHAYGKGANTPNIDLLAAAGLSFTRVVPEAMPTVPARNSFLTGQRQFPFRNWHDYPGLLEVPGWFPIKDPQLTWPAVMRRAGYWTGYVTDNPFLSFASPYAPLRASFDLFERRGGQIGGTDQGVSKEELRHWLHPSLRSSKHVDRVRRYIANSHYANDETKSFAAKVFTSGAEVLERAAKGRKPFALVVDTFEPHEPWTPPPRYLEMYGDPDWDGPEPGTIRYARTSKWLTREEAPAVLQRMRALYAAEVTMTDRWLGVLLERLSDLGRLEDTVIILAADHGIFFGERGWTGKISIALHPELVHVPLIIVDPARRRAGDETPYRASPHDIGPTILSMTGVPAPDVMEGHDLSPLLDLESPPPRPWVYGGYTNSHYVRTIRWTFMAENHLQNPQLFDRDEDPGELRNVADDHPDVVRELHERVLEAAGGKLPYYPQ